MVRLMGGDNNPLEIQKLEKIYYYLNSYDLFIF